MKTTSRGRQREVTLVAQKIRESLELDGPQTRTELRSSVGVRTPLDLIKDALAALGSQDVIYILEYMPERGRPGKRIYLNEQ